MGFLCSAFFVKENQGQKVRICLISFDTRSIAGQQKQGGNNGGV